MPLFSYYVLIHKKPPTYVGGYSTSRWVSLTPHLNPISSCVEATNFLPREVIIPILPKLLVIGKGFLINYTENIGTILINKTQS